MSTFSHKKWDRAGLDILKLLMHKKIVFRRNAQVEIVRPKLDPKQSVSVNEIEADFN